MKRELTALSLALTLTFALAACGESPKPQAKAEPGAPPVAAPAPVAAAPAVAPAPTPAPQEEKADPNKELAKRVKQALEGESKIQAAAIDVTAAEGKVTLWGTAASTDERNRATRAAYRVQGVIGVENKIAVVKGS